MCRACGEVLGYRTSATDILNLDDQLYLCLHCFDEAHRGILLVWTNSTCPQSGAGTVPRQQEGRKKTDG